MTDIYHRDDIPDDLRIYFVRAEMGLEPTPDEFVSGMVAVFREVRRVLRDDGTLWVNIGDSYANDAKWGGSSGGKHAQALHGGTGIGRGKRTTGMKPKDLIGIPWMLAFALRADGWYLRSEIIWHKPNPMPESVTDRPTKAHEQVFLFSKMPRYFYDADAISEPATYAGRVDTGHGTSKDFDAQKQRTLLRGTRIVPETRNARSVWTIATKPFSEAHFATFPLDLPERCIKAGTSDRGCCATCGAPWVRVTEKVDTGRKQKAADGWDVGPGAHGTIHRQGRTKGHGGAPVMEAVTVGWEPSCQCDAPTIPCTVLDPFGGAGTTGLVADRLQRHAILIELNPEYAEMARRRIAGDASLFAEVKA